MWLSSSLGFMTMRRDKLRNGPLSKKEPALDHLENSLPTQTGPPSGKRAEGVAGQSLTQGRNQPPRKPGTETRLTKKDPWGPLWSEGLDVNELHGRLTRFLRLLHEQQRGQPRLKGTERE